eukprot:c22292_g1_i1 orf=131-928(-)
MQTLMMLSPSSPPLPPPLASHHSLQHQWQQISKYYLVKWGNCIRKPGWKMVIRNNFEISHQKQESVQFPSRRRLISLSATSYITSLVVEALHKESAAVEFTDMPALRGKDYGKSKMHYPDFIETESGLQYKDLRLGSGPSPREGEVVVVDWDGYTVGYYGHIFEARNKPKGGSFEGNEKGYLKFKLGSQEVIPAFEEAIATMNIGGVRRILVPPTIGYPGADFNKKGPRPTTFSGQRALDFVLKNQGLIDKTLLFDIELLKIYPK